MPLPLAVPLAAGLLSGGYKTVTGIGQQSRGRRLRRDAQAEFDRNPYTTPTEALQALSSAQNLAGQTELPGQSALEAQIQSATGSAIQAKREAAVSPQDIIAGATDVYQNLYVNPLRNLTVQAASRYDANQANLQSQLNNVAQYRDREWQQNVLLPYQNALATAGQLSSAGQQNIASGFGDIAGSLTNYAIASNFAQQAAANTAAIRSPNVVNPGRSGPIISNTETAPTLPIRLTVPNVANTIQSPYNTPVTGGNPTTTPVQQGFIINPIQGRSQSFGSFNNPFPSRLQTSNMINPF